MAQGRRISREKATAELAALLETICAGGAHARCVTGVYVFGSYARGALTVGDVDVDVEYDARLDPGVERELLDRLVAGRDWNTPFRQALKPGRSLQIMFNRLDMIAEPVAVYGRGDTLDAARARVEAIAADPTAGRARRDPVHPALEAVVDDLIRPNRILLTELLAAGLLRIEVIELADADEAELGDPAFVTRVRLRWRSRTSPLARAARAAAAYLQASGADLARTALLPKGVLDQENSRWAVDCRETHLRELLVYMGHNRIAEALFVLHPQRKGRLRALKLTAPRPASLPTSDIADWLSKRAPHIHKIG